MVSTNSRDIGPAKHRKSTCSFLIAELPSSIETDCCRSRVSQNRPAGITSVWKRSRISARSILSKHHWTACVGAVSPDSVSDTIRILIIGSHRRQLHVQQCWVYIRQCRCTSFSTIDASSQRVRGLDVQASQNKSLSGFACNHTLRRILSKYRSAYTLQPLCYDAIDPKLFSRF